jgi:hypothetical protein
MAGGEAHLSGGCGGRDTSSFMPRSSFGHVVFAGPVRGLRSATWPHTLPIPIFFSVTAMSLRKGEVRDLISESLTRAAERRLMVTPFSPWPGLGRSSAMMN